MQKILLATTCLFMTAITAVAQLQPVFTFQADDSLLKRNYYNETVRKKEVYLQAAPKEHAKDYKEIYDQQFESIGDTWKSSRVMTAPAAHAYLQSLVKKITDSNPVLKDIDARIVFSRDWWPNAVSMGDGTIFVNAGLLIFLENEAELAFVICHELSHYYLDHMNKTIRKNVELFNSESFKAEIKRISKEEYRVGSQIQNLVKKLAFGDRRHSREYEMEADRHAFMFLKHSGYDAAGIKTCLQKLSVIDDTLIYGPLKTEQVFHFDEYPFKKKWTQKESVLFGAMTGDDSPLTQAERDSLRTHPDCEKRIAWLVDSIQSVPAGKKFQVDEQLFRQFKKDFFVEITEEQFREENLTRHLYYSLLLLQAGEYTPYAVYATTRCLNKIYELQKNHRLGLATTKEHRGNPEDYNLLLRLVDRVRLEDIASINYFFCKKYASQMSGYAGFADEMKKAEKTFSEYKPRN